MLIIAKLFTGIILALLPLIALAIWFFGTRR